MSTSDSNTPPPSFEQAIARLEEIVARIDNPETGLEEMIALTAEGHQLIRRSRLLLEQAELKIRTLSDPVPDSAAELPQPAAQQKNKTAASKRPASPSPDDHGFSLFS